jgi:2-phospho-L-lactate guanylyltransferase
VSSPTPHPRIAAIIPVGTLEGAKTRLGGTIDAEERQDLVEGMLTRTVEAALAVQADGRLADVVVVSPDRAVLALATAIGARTLRQRSRGLNHGLQEARDDVAAGGADAVLVLPIDLALITPETIEPLIDAIDAAPRGVVLVTDRHETGTNALGLRPPDVIGFCFGPGSRAKHRSAAAAADVPYTELEGPLALDLDTPEDLVLIESIAPERLGVG